MSAEVPMSQEERRDRIRERLFVLGVSVDEASGQQKKTHEEECDDPKFLERWRFSEDRCGFCGKTNSELEGRLLQCSRCERFHFCSPECFQKGLPEHSKFCMAGTELHQLPKKKKADQDTEKVSDEKAEEQQQQPPLSPQTSEDSKPKKKKSPRKSPKKKPGTVSLSPESSPTKSTSRRPKTPTKSSPARRPKTPSSKKTPKRTPKKSNKTSAASKKGLMLPEINLLDDDKEPTTTTTTTTTTEHTATTAASAAASSNEPVLSSAAANRSTPAGDDDDLPITTTTTTTDGNNNDTDDSRREARTDTAEAEEPSFYASILSNNDDQDTAAAANISQNNNPDQVEEGTVGDDSTIEEVVYEYVDVKKKKKEPKKKAELTLYDELVLGHSNDGDDDDNTIEEYIFEYDKPTGAVLVDGHNDSTIQKAFGKQQTDGAILTMGGDRLVVLIAGFTPSLHVILNQQGALNFLTSNEVLFDVVDATEPRSKAKTALLLELSGRRTDDDYPQFFLQKVHSDEDSMTIEFWGGSDEFDQAKKDGSLADAFPKTTISKMRRAFS